MGEHQPTLYLMLGYPGAGKTTTAEIIAHLSGATHLASDTIRLEMFPEPQFTSHEHDALYKELDRRTEALLLQGQDVIYDANLNLRAHRQEKYDICTKLHTVPLLIWLRTPRDISKTRATHTSRSNLWPEGEAGDEMFDRLVDVFEPPAPSEQFIEVDGTKINEEYIRQALHLKQ